MEILLKNQTPFPASYKLLRGNQVIASLPAIAPNAQVSVPTNITYQVIAETVIDGNRYQSAPIDVGGSRLFLAQILQVATNSQGTYEFVVEQKPSSEANTLQFESTCASPVTFTIVSSAGAAQRVVVGDDLFTQSLDISNTYSVSAIIEGVTLKTRSFTNPSQTVTAKSDTSTFASSYSTLELS